MYCKYAGIILSDVIRISNIEESLIPSRENYTVNIASRHGEIYSGYKYKSKKIKLEFSIHSTEDEYEECEMVIASALDVESPSRLYLGDTDKYYYAIPDGETTIDKIATGLGHGEVTFVCYDPIKYSDEVKLYTGANSVNVVNTGTSKTYPSINISFMNEATFAQVNDTKSSAAILVGQWPNVNQPTTPAKGIVINDNCTVLTDWLAVGNVLDADRLIDGNVMINSGGYAITPSNFGTAQEGGKWRGPARRRNMGRNIRDFEVVAEFEFDSKGKNASDNTNTPPTDPGTSNNMYKTTANLNVREGRSTSYKILTTMPKGTQVAVTDISAGWGKVTYNGKTGYSSMQYLTLVQDSNANYTVKTNSGKGLNLRTGRSTSYKVLLSIPNGTAISVSDIQNGWGKTTYKNNTGYISMQYTSPRASTKSVSTVSEETADDKLGLVELYGFDGNGNKLFKMSLTDANEWYEYTHPEVQIGNSVVIKDNDTVPAPRTHNETNDKGEEETITDLSGKYGKWNEFFGQIRIRRERVNNKDQWTCEVNKLSGGSVTATLKTSSLANNSYPMGDLNNVVLYFGQYAKSPTCAMTLTSLKVEQLNEIPPAVIPKIFKRGDNLRIECGENMIYLNDIPFMTNTDIGSQFFGVEAGDTQLKMFSDDKAIYTSVGITERWFKR